ncbi:hypothetical protein DNTS_031642, partial [Danionella cerebrum]
KQECTISHLRSLISGGHVNPAVSLGMVILGKLPLKKFPIYVAAQFIGAFLGSCAVFCLYYGAFAEFADGQLLVIGTGALVLCILAIIDKKNIGAPKGMEPLLVGLSILAIAVSMALNCGYPINPARDLGPRLFTAVAGWGLDVFSAGGGWWWVPVVGPMVGGVVGAVIYFLMVELHHPESDKNLEEDNSIKEKYELNTVN